MRIVFKKIPKIALWFYGVGFFLIGSALLSYNYSAQQISLVLIQQCFILGAIIVALGSCINVIAQFKQKTTTSRDHQHAKRH